MQIRKDAVFESNAFLGGSKINIAKFTPKITAKQP